MGDKVPYLGSRIVLISKSEIRYEGTLYAIDTNNSTVALQNVRSFGTEDRKAEGAIPPSAEVGDLVAHFSKTRYSRCKKDLLSPPPMRNSRVCAEAKWKA